MQEYEEIRKIGKGAFADVFLCRHKETNEEVADKRIEMAYLCGVARDTVYEEAKIMDRFSQSNHPNVVRFVSIKQYQSEGIFHIYMEYCSGGSLGEELSQRKTQNEFYRETEVLNYLRQTASGLAFIHKSNVIHRDLKPANILKTETGLLKIADFGLGAALAHSCSDRKTKAGTPVYTAPEVIKEDNYSFSCDVWSLGVTVYELLTMRLPFTAKNEYALLDKIVKMPFEPVDVEISDQLATLLTTMLNKTASERPSSSSIAEMEFVAGHQPSCFVQQCHSIATTEYQLTQASTQEPQPIEIEEEPENGRPDRVSLNSTAQESESPIIDEVTQLMPQSTNEDPEVLKELAKCQRTFEEGDLNSDGLKWTLLHYLCCQGKAELVRVLIKRGENIHARSNNGYTPLHWASRKGHLEVVRVLFDYNADIEAKDDDNWTPLHLASFGDHVEMVRLLLQQGAQANAQANDGKTPLSVTESDAVRCLLKEHCDNESEKQKPNEKCAII